MKAFLIDPAARSVIKVDILKRQFDSEIEQIIGGKPDLIHCTMRSEHGLSVHTTGAGAKVVNNVFTIRDGSDTLTIPGKAIVTAAGHRELPLSLKEFTGLVTFLSFTELQQLLLAH